MRVLSVAVLLCGAAAQLEISVDWSRPRLRSRTAATVEVDVMPFLARQPATAPTIRQHYGGPFRAYQQALAGLNASLVRFAPWCPNPRLVVPELRPPDCTSAAPTSNWNSSFLDQLLGDFMRTVCGPEAARGGCARLSVVMQLSTMPAWLYEGGMRLDQIPANPYVPTPGGHKQYEQGAALVDPSCRSMAEHIGRVVGWFTQGGFHDGCGHWHGSGLRYRWWGLSILNEDEHQIKPGGGVAYTRCFDAVRQVLGGIHPDLRLIGPEISGSASYPSSQFEYLAYFMNRSHHQDGVAPSLGSYHVGLNLDNASAAQVFESWDAVLEGFAPAADKLLGPNQQLLLNEFVNSVQDWCATPHTNGCPDWQQPSTAGGDPDLTHGKGVHINRETWSWNAAAGVFAYAFGTLAERGYLLVGQDQLVAGTWPDNEPAVAMLDWMTGQPNAKYFVTQLLASTVGAAAEKTLYGLNNSDPSTVYALPFEMTAGGKGALLVNKKPSPVKLSLLGLALGSQATVVEVAPGFKGGAGFAPPTKRVLAPDGGLELGPFAVAVVLE